MHQANRGTLSEWHVVEGWRLETCTFDILHNIYLGVGRDLVASAIWLFVRQGMYDHLAVDDMDDLLGHIHMGIQATCKQHGYLANFQHIFSYAWYMWGFVGPVHRPLAFFSGPFSAPRIGGFLFQANLF